MIRSFYGVSAFLCLTTLISIGASEATTLTRDSVSEVRRLRAHFDSVDRELRSHSTAGISDTQRAARTRLITWLRDYRNEGQFPQNDGQSEEYVPIFRDHRGTLCAMAYLIDRSGRRDVVDRVAATRNLAYIGELTDDSALVNWLEANGLTWAEAARIQPTYSPKKSTSVESSRLWTSAAVMGVDAVATGFMLVKPSQSSVTIGLLGGVAAVALGTAHLKDGGDSRTLAQATTAVGAVTTGVGFWRAVTPSSWYRTGPMGKTLGALDKIRVTARLSPDGDVGPALGFTTAFR